MLLEVCGNWEGWEVVCTLLLVFLWDGGVLWLVRVYIFLSREVWDEAGGRGCFREKDEKRYLLSILGSIDKQK